MTLTVTPSGQACGARIEGIDLTQELTDSHRRTQTTVAEAQGHRLA